MIMRTFGNMWCLIVVNLRYPSSWKYQKLQCYHFGTEGHPFRITHVPLSFPQDKPYDRPKGITNHEKGNDPLHPPLPHSFRTCLGIVVNTGRQLNFEVDKVQKFHHFYVVGCRLIILNVAVPSLVPSILCWSTWDDFEVVRQSATRKGDLIILIRCHSLTTRSLQDCAATRLSSHKHFIITSIMYHQCVNTSLNKCCILVRTK